MAEWHDLRGSACSPGECKKAFCQSFKALCNWRFRRFYPAMLFETLATLIGVVLCFYPHVFPMSRPELLEEAILHFLREIIPLIRWKI